MLFSRTDPSLHATDTATPLTVACDNVAVCEHSPSAKTPLTVQPAQQYPAVEHWADVVQEPDVDILTKI